MKRELTERELLLLRYQFQLGGPPAPDSPMGRGEIKIKLKPLEGRELRRAKRLHEQEEEVIQRERSVAKLWHTAESLARYLNDKCSLPDETGQRQALPHDGRVEQVLILIKELKACKSYTTREFFADKLVKAELRRQSDLQHELHKLLSKFEFHPEVTFEPSEGMYRTLVGWEPLLRPTDQTDGEFFALLRIHNLMEVVKGGSLDRLRRCTAPDCQRWFYAHTNKKVVCSDSCRFRKYQSKQETKKKKRDYMREYFRNPKVKARLRAKANRKVDVKRSTERGK